MKQFILLNLLWSQRSWSIGFGFGRWSGVQESMKVCGRSTGMRYMLWFHPQGRRESSKREYTTIMGLLSPYVHVTKLPINKCSERIFPSDAHPSTRQTFCRWFAIGFLLTGFQTTRSTWTALYFSKLTHPKIQLTKLIDWNFVWKAGLVQSWPGA